MKKFICLVLIFVLMLTACSNRNVEIVDPTKPGESESEIAAPEEEKTDESHMEMVKEIEKAFSPDYLFYDETEFEELGIEVSVNNIEIKDERNWTATVKLKREEFELSIDISGIRTSFEVEGNKWSHYYWGTFIFTGNDTIAFCGKEKVLFFDEWNLEAMDIDFDFPEKTESETWVNGAAFVPENEAYYLFTSEISENEADIYADVSKYDMNGNFIEEKNTMFVGSEELRGEFYPRFMEKAVLFELEGLDFVNTGNNFCGIGNEKTYGASKDTEAENDYRCLEIYTYYSEDYGIDYFDGNRMVFLYSCGNLLRYFAFVEDNLSVIYNEEDEISLFGADDKYVYYSDHFAMSLELDFADETHKLNYNPTDKHTEGGVFGTKSSDGKYSICGFGETSGGDAVDWHVAIRNNETGKYVYIGRRGGIWGGTGGDGFFKNNDFYSWTYHELTILDPETGDVKFDLGKNFSLGYDEKTESERGILTFRRDPEDFSFIVVYYEYKNGYESIETEDEKFGWHEELSFNYKIGFLDSEGNLIESCDTGIPVWKNSIFGLHSVDMNYSADKLTLTVKSVGKGESGFVGVFDMNTKEFEISPLK